MAAGVRRETPPTYAERVAKRLAKAAKNRVERMTRQTPEVCQPLAEAPEFFPKRLALQRISDKGTVLIQQTHKFSLSGVYIGEVPLEEAYITTEVMERNHERDQARWRAKTTQASQFARNSSPIPEALIKIGAENAQALLAERLAE